MKLTTLCTAALALVAMLVECPGIQIQCYESRG